MKRPTVANYLTLAEPPQQGELGWVENLRRQIPYGQGGFEDNIFQRPPDPFVAQSLDFDKMGVHENPAFQEWRRQNPDEPNILEYARRMMQSPQRLR